MKNVLSGKQKHQLNVWVEEVGPLAFESRKNAVQSATDDLKFKVTNSNLESAENSTEVYVVKKPEPKKTNDLEARIAKLENDLASFREYCKGCALPIIKTRANKPLFCHNNG